MFARKGDQIVIRTHRNGTPVRAAEVLQVEQPDGSPPYRVRWSDTGHEALIFPGSDAYVSHRSGNASPTHAPR